MLEKSSSLRVSEDQKPSGSELIKKLIAPITTAAALALATGCAGAAFEQTEDRYDAGTTQPNDGGTDSPIDSQQDAEVDSTPDAEPDAQPDTTKPDAPITPDSGCNGTEITLENMDGYELLHTGFNCNPVKLDTTTNNEEFESENRTLCLEPGDQLVVMSYYNDGQNVKNNFRGTSTTPFNPAQIKRGEINLDIASPDSYYMLTSCLGKIETTSMCVAVAQDIDSDPTRFDYPGKPDCGTTNPARTASLFYVTMAH